MKTMSSSQKTSFWHNAIIYQVYPWTFFEDPDRRPLGNGSIRGITQKLNYIQSLGANALWVSPFFASPMIDGGYDVTDYTQVHPLLGTIEDVDELIAKLHERGMKLMIDFIPNHTSDRHPWFVQSRASKRTVKKDWYIWHNGRRGVDGSLQPPNNWARVFSLPQLERRKAGLLDLPEGAYTPPLSAWEFDGQRNQFYLASFSDAQPDLNWSNVGVRKAMKDQLRFWLDRGVDGFRIDAANHIGKNMELPDEEPDTSYQEGVDNPYDQLRRHNSCDYPETLHHYLDELTDVLKEPAYRERDARFIYEAYMEENDLDYLNRLCPEKATTFNFGALDRISWSGLPRKLQLDSYYSRLPKKSIANHVNGNHDKDRLASRIGDDAARAAAVFTLCLSGMRFIYNGEELNLRNGYVSTARRQDPNGLRDPERTPIPWHDTRKNAGFSTAPAHELYLPINKNDIIRAVNVQLRQSTSPLRLYQAIGELMKENTILQCGKFASRTTNDHDVVAYAREYQGFEVLVLTNFSDTTKEAMVDNTTLQQGNIVLSSLPVHESIRRIDLSKPVRLEPYEAIVITA